jgi:hypothetical protein
VVSQFEHPVWQLEQSEEGWQLQFCWFCILPKGIPEFIGFVMDWFIIEGSIDDIMGFILLDIGDIIPPFIPIPFIIPGIMLFAPIPSDIGDIILLGPKPMPIELFMPIGLLPQANVAKGRANIAATDAPVTNFVSLFIFVCVLLIIIFSRAALRASSYLLLSIQL